MTCKDCFYRKVCDTWFENDYELQPDDCSFFKDKGKIIELPCKEGQKVYFISKRYTACSAYNEYYDEYSCQGCETACDSELIKEIKECSFDINGILLHMQKGSFGKSLFLSKEEAEKTLKEMMEK